MKIFGIGLSKTGTRSLAQALQILGYTTIHYPWSMEDIHNHEASLDIPVACRYKELDILYPNSKFILTTRPFNEWLSRRKTKPKDPHQPPLWKIECRVKMYGHVEYNEEIYTKAYYDHHEDVIRHFKDRPNDLLVLPLYDSDKWKLVCDFLNKEIPSIEYPWEGQSKTLFKFL